jgi:hypothetical protein
VTRRDWGRRWHRGAGVVHAGARGRTREDCMTPSADGVARVVGRGARVSFEGEGSSNHNFSSIEISRRFISLALKPSVTFIIARAPVATTGALLDGHPACRVPGLCNKLLLIPSSPQMPSRQERRKAERDAAKRAQAQAPPAQAQALLANVNVTPPLGDWTTQAGDPGELSRALGPRMVKQRADAGDREAQYTQGFA